MATYNTAFGSLPGYNEMLGTTNTTGGGQQQTYGQTTQTSTTRPPYQAAQTFAQMQRQGVARPAPPTAPQAQPFAQYGGSQQAQQMRQRLQEQLQQFGQAPSRFDTQAFQQIRGAQAANLQQEYRGQLQALNEELARRGLSASSVGGGRMGDLAGQQARALASLDAELLQRAAETQAQDRAQLLSASQGLAELASAQDLAQFEANRVAQAATFENQLRAAQFGQQQFEQAGQEAFQGAQAEEAARQAERQFGLQATGQAANLSLELQRLLGQQEMERAQLTGELEGADTLAARQFESQRELERAQLTGRLGTGATAQDTLAARQLALQEDLQRAGLTGRLGEGAAAQDTLAAQQQQFQQRQVLFQQAQQMSEQSGVQYTVDENNRVVPLRDAQGNVVRTSDFTQAAEARKLQQDELTLRRQLGLMEATGQGLTVDAEGRIVAGTGPTAQTLQARQIATQERQLAFQNAARLSEQSGVQYTVDDRGNVVPLRDAQGNAVRTSAETQAAEARKLQSEELTLRRQLGLMEATGQGLTVDAEGRIVAGTGATAQTLQARQLAFQNAARLSEQSGVQYTVDATGQPVVLRDAQGNPVRTSAFTQADEARKQQQEQFNIAQFGKAGTIQSGTQTLAALQQQLQQAGITGKFEGQLTQEALQNAYARAAQLTQATGQQYTVDPATGAITAGGSTLEARLREAGITGTFGGALTQQALQDAYARAAQLSQITGQQYTVNPATGAITPATGEAGRTFAAQLQAAGITGQFGGALTQEALQNAYQRAAQLSQITGKQYTVNSATGAITEGTADTLASQLQRAGLTGELGGQATLERLQQNLQQAQIMSQITGQQFTVDANGNLVRGTADTEARRQFTLENMLRQALGMSEATGYVYDPITGARTSAETVQGQIARSQTLLALAGALGNLTPEQIAQLLGKAPPTTQAGDTTTTRSSGTTTTSLANPKDGDTKTEGGKNYVYRGVWPTGQWVEQTTSITTTTTDTKPTQPTTTTTKATENPTTTTKDPMATTPLLDRQQAIINDSLVGPKFDGRYQYNGTLGGWAVYKNGQWYSYGATPPTQSVVIAGRQTLVYPGYATMDPSNGINIIWDGTKFIAF